MEPKLKIDIPNLKAQRKECNEPWRKRKKKKNMGAWEERE